MVEKSKNLTLQFQCILKLMVVQQIWPDRRNERDPILHLIICEQPTFPIASTAHLCYWLLDKSSEESFSTFLILQLFVFITFFSSKLSIFFFFPYWNHSCLWSLPQFSSLKPSIISSCFIFAVWEEQIGLAAQLNSFQTFTLWKAFLQNNTF